MTISVLSGSAWNSMISMSVNSGSSWVNAKEVYVLSGSGWQKAFSYILPPTGLTLINASTCDDDGMGGTVKNLKIDVSWNNPGPHQVKVYYGEDPAPARTLLTTTVAGATSYQHVLGDFGGSSGPYGPFNYAIESYDGSIESDKSEEEQITIDSNPCGDS